MRQSFTPEAGGKLVNLGLFFANQAVARFAGENHSTLRPSFEWLDKLHQEFCFSLQNDVKSTYMVSFYCVFLLNNLK